jgi:hypothetical protein
VKHCCVPIALFCFLTKYEIWLDSPKAERAFRFYHIPSHIQGCLLNCLWPDYTSDQVWIKKTNSLAFSPQANYTAWATATCWWNLVPIFADSGVSRGQRGRSPTVVTFSFLDQSRYFSFQVALHLCSQGWEDPIPNPLLLRKSGRAGNRTRDLWISSQEVWPLVHRSGHQVWILTQNSSFRMHFGHIVLFSATNMVGLWKFLELTNSICYSFIYC